MIEKEVLDMIKNTYQEGYSVISQVRNKAGFDATRTADALIFCHWPSRGISISGIEIKVGRGDWLKELTDPKKSDEIAKYCDYWYVASPPKIINKEEVPESWGLMYTQRKRMKIIKRAEKLNPVSLTPDFVTCIMRRFHEQVVSQDDLVQEYKKGYDKGYDEGRKLEKDLKSWEFKRIEGDLSRLRKNVDKFEESSGVKLNQWKCENIGEAVKRVLEGLDIKSRLTYMKNNLERALESINKVMEEGE